MNAIRPQLGAQPLIVRLPTSNTCWATYQGQYRAVAGTLTALCTELMALDLWQKPILTQRTTLSQVRQVTNQFGFETICRAP